MIELDRGKHADRRSIWVLIAFIRNHRRSVVDGLGTLFPGERVVDNRFKRIQYAVD